MGTHYPGVPPWACPACKLRSSASSSIHPKSGASRGNFSRKLEISHSSVEFEVGTAQDGWAESVSTCSVVLGHKYFFCKSPWLLKNIIQKDVLTYVL